MAPSLAVWLGLVGVGVLVGACTETVESDLPANPSSEPEAPVEAPADSNPPPDRNGECELYVEELCRIDGEACSDFRAIVSSAGMRDGACASARHRLAVFVSMGDFGSSADLNVALQALVDTVGHVKPDAPEAILERVEKLHERVWGTPKLGPRYDPRPRWKTTARRNQMIASARKVATSTGACRKLGSMYCPDDANCAFGEAFARAGADEALCQKQGAELASLLNAAPPELQGSIVVESAFRFFEESPGISESEVNSMREQLASERRRRLGLE